MLALNFVRSTFSAAWLKESAWSGSDFEKLLMARSKDFVAFCMLARDRLMCSENPWVMLGVRCSKLPVCSGCELKGLFSLCCVPVHDC